MAWYLHAVCIITIIAVALDLIYIFIVLIKEIRKGCKSKQNWSIQQCRRRLTTMVTEKTRNDIEIKREVCEILRDIRACVPHPIHPDQEKYVKLADVEMIFKRHADKLDARIREGLRERGE